MFTSSWSSCANSVCSVCRSSGEIIAILHFPLFLFMVRSTNMQGLPAISQPLVHCANPLYSVYLLPGLKSNVSSFHRRFILLYQPLYDSSALAKTPTGLPAVVALPGRVLARPVAAPHHRCAPGRGVE